MHCTSIAKTEPYTIFITLFAILSTLQISTIKLLLTPIFFISNFQTPSLNLSISLQTMAFKNSFFLIFFLSLFHLTPGGEDSKQKELVIGSRPPQCFSKCLNCRPCVAALVISQRHKAALSNLDSPQIPKDDAYYLLSWKCKCKDKYFQP